MVKPIWKYRIDAKRYFVEVKKKSENSEKTEKKEKIPVISRTMYVFCVQGDPPGPKNYKITLNKRYKREGIIKYSVTKHIILHRPFWENGPIEIDEWEKPECWTLEETLKWLNAVFCDKTIALQSICDLETEPLT